MRALAVVAALAFVPLASVPTATARAEPFHTRFTLYKMMNRIGVEASTIRRELSGADS